MKFVDSLLNFAQLIHRLLRSDRDVVIGVGGFTGEGKSTFTVKLIQAYVEASGMKWDFDLMTWSRKELMTWIDGKPKSKVLSNGLKEGQLPEYTAVVPDELFRMFYRRTWFEDSQIDAIATFNMCRDRHLLVCGNVPNFWDLDTAFTSRIRFYVYIPERGKAWVFEQENNPFAKDNWNVQENKKSFRKKKKPYGLQNFVCEIRFPDFTKEEKAEYYLIRNKKRLQAIQDSKSQRVEKYSAMRKRLISLIHYVDVFRKEKKMKKLPNRFYGEVLDYAPETVRLLRGETEEE